MEKKSISKDLLIKIIVIALVAVIAITGVTLWLTLYRPFDDSYKSVTIQIVDEVNGYNKTFNVRTNKSYLGDLIDEKEQWGITTSGIMPNRLITGLNGKLADDANGYYVWILTNDENNQWIDEYNNVFTASNGEVCNNAAWGIDMLPLVDGTTYVLIVIQFS